MALELQAASDETNTAGGGELEPGEHPAAEPEDLPTKRRNLNQNYSKGEAGNRS